MFKSKILATLTLALAAVALLSTMTLARTALAAGDDVFMDEGDGDFDSMPDQATQAAAPAKKTDTAVPKIAEPPPAAPAEESEEMPILTDDSSPSMTPTSDDESSPSVTAYPKEKKSKKKKSAKKVAVSTEDEEAPVATLADATPETPHKKAVSAAGSFVTTKEACPMMRSPASTGETMLTVKASKKIWVEDAGEGWVKAFNKAGEPGYVSRDCVQ